MQLTAEKIRLNYYNVQERFTNSDADKTLVLSIGEIPRRRNVLYITYIATLEVFNLL